MRGLRVREAQARCPELVVQPYDDALDHRAFEPVIRAVEAAVPGVEVLRPGTLALRARGPARYYGGERAAAATLAGIAADHGAPAVRAGVADTPFAAEQAARARPVRPGERVPASCPSADRRTSWRTCRSACSATPTSATVLDRLGITTLGDVRGTRRRTGAGPVRRWPGRSCTGSAGGRDPREIAAREIPPELRVEASFEPPLDRADQIAFAFRRSADDFAERLRAAGLVATTIRVGIVDERDILLERTWAHPRWFDAADVVDRVRWQLAGGVDPSGLEAPVTSVRARAGRRRRHGEPRARAVGLRPGRARAPRPRPDPGHGRPRRCGDVRASAGAAPCPSAWCSCRGATRPPAVSEPWRPSETARGPASCPARPRHRARAPPTGRRRRRRWCQRRRRRARRAVRRTRTVPCRGRPRAAASRP